MVVDPDLFTTNFDTRLLTLHINHKSYTEDHALLTVNGKNTPAGFSEQRRVVIFTEGCLLISVVMSNKKELFFHYLPFMFC